MNTASEAKSISLEKRKEKIHEILLKNQGVFSELHDSITKAANDGVFNANFRVIFTDSFTQKDFQSALEYLGYMYSSYQMGRGYDYRLYWNI